MALAFAIEEGVNYYYFLLLEITLTTYYNSNNNNNKKTGWLAGSEKWARKKAILLQCFFLFHVKEIIVCER